MLERSVAVLGKKRASFVESAYAQTKTYRSLVEFSEQMTPEQKPKLIVVGCPAEFRGSDIPGRDLELQLLKLFPDTPLFIEKPVAAGEVSRTFRVAEAIEKSQVLHSVGFVISILEYTTHPKESHRYMLRYLKAVQTMKKIIRDNNLTVMATIARYASAYEAIVKPDWWNKDLRSVSIRGKPQSLLIISSSGGPVIEQGTHFCDLSRYFGGDVDIQTVQAHALLWDEAPGKLSKIGIDESKVDPSKRIPRVTTANWWAVRFSLSYERETEFCRLTVFLAYRKYKNGAVGTFTHLASLQGTAYACELEVYCDGYLFK
jgi:Putative oxidoreductase C terminal domain/Oxidoreductase family, NAD-binding Rossmann fold